MKTNYLWGLLLIFLGIIFGLNALEITNINVFFKGWWTLFIIVPCLFDLFNNPNKTGDLIGICIGSCLLLVCQDIISLSLISKLLFPIILIIIGLSIIFKDTIDTKIKKEMKKLSKNNKEYCSIFGSQTINFNKENFEGCNLNAIFGGIKLDLREAIIEKDCVIDADSIFGGITIYTPNDVNVKVCSTPIFGGVSDERKTKNKDSKITVYLNATCMFGGVEIK